MIQIKGGKRKTEEALQSAEGPRWLPSIGGYEKAESVSGYVVPGCAG
ncbi:hypothetical protein [Acetobacter orleanensis]|uniref:Uncharacterized protein n=1 Tax=Acetobacter orleanensis TaxID=104099 RepID=A0A4Y3TK09_9PROT|nr:hypothetical protein [Acetobacter orleanensis]GAN68764.1 hypothetical protein Abol_021_119 [Acetobacter orleanensis JCM 7639]GEB82262.1 hypothetical protein AOR01nite_07390 [Acetobacter orleanensis]